MVADGPAQYWNERIQDRALRDLSLDLERHFIVDARQRSKVMGERDSNHLSV